MKKIKFCGNQLKRIGYVSDCAIVLTINLVKKKFKRSEKLEIFEIPEKINLHS